MPLHKFPWKDRGQRYLNAAVEFNRSVPLQAAASAVGCLESASGDPRQRWQALETRDLRVC